VLADGEITPDEAAQLEQIRRRMGISKEEAFQITSETSRSVYLATFCRIVQDGQITPDEQQQILRSKQALCVSDDQASDIIRGEALTLYKQYFSNVIQDGVVTAEEEERLAWLQKWTGLRDSDVVPYHPKYRKSSGLRRIDKVIYLPSGPG
jgi:hypothetical protein